MAKLVVIGSLDADTFADNIVDAGIRLGHDMIGVGPSQPDFGSTKLDSLVGLFSERMPQLRTYLQRSLVNRVLNANPDVIIVVDRRLSVATLSQMRSNGAKIVLWFPDAVHNFGRLDMFLAGYDRIFIKNPLVVKQLADVYGIPAKYLPEAANPSWHRPSVEYGSDPHITVAGNIYPTRALLLDRLLSIGLPVRIYGPPMPTWINLPRVREAHMNRSITRQEKSKVFRSSIAVLNNLHPAEFAGSNCRLFEAAASGAVVLTEKRPGMEHLFEYDTEVVTFDTFESLVDSYKKLVDNPDFAQSVANRAAERAATDHTWDQRLKELLESL